MEHVSQQVTMKAGFLAVEGGPLRLLLLAQRANTARSSEKTRVAYLTVFVRLRLQSLNSFMLL